MKTERNILIAFILNLGFSVFEFFGGIFTGSVAIISDAVHDAGDALSIGVSYLLERKSKRQPDDKYTYGYMRFSVLGSLFTSLVLLIGSIAVLYNAIIRFLNPVEINYNGMIIFAIVGTIVNLGAAFFTHGGDSLNQKAVNLHMLEDVFGWIAVLVGAVIMKFTDISVIDPILSAGLAIFIIINAARNLIETTDIFLEKIPQNTDIKEIEEHLLKIDGVAGVHHVHIWSMDYGKNYATMHVVSNGDAHKVKEKIREELREHGIGHSTIEIENEDEHCDEIQCRIESQDLKTHSHHHHHH